MKMKASPGPGDQGQCRGTGGRRRSVLYFGAKTTHHMSGRGAAGSSIFVIQDAYLQSWERVLLRTVARNHPLRAVEVEEGNTVDSSSTSIVPAESNWKVNQVGPSLSHLLLGNSIP